MGPLDLSAPASLVLCAATTATVPFSRGRFACRSLPHTLSASVVCDVLYGLMSEWKPEDHARAFGHLVPHSGNVVKARRG